MTSVPGEGRAIDVAVVGAGPAGIAAATRAAECGQRVLLIDENPAIGGQIWRHRSGVGIDASARVWIDRLECSGVVRRQGAGVVDAHRVDGAVALELEGGAESATIYARRLIIATGARERFLPFPGWTLPGVLGIGGAQALLKAGASFTGARIVIAGSGPLLFPVASSLAGSGAHVVFVAEQADGRAVRAFARSLWTSPRLLLQAAKYRGAFLRTPYRCGWWVTEARGEKRLEEVVLTNGAETKTIPCTVLCAGFGLVPNTELARSLGCELGASGVRTDDLQETSIAGVFCAGEPTGIGGVDLAIAEGEVAGYAAADSARKCGDAQRRVRRYGAYAARLEAAFGLREELKHLARGDTIVCRCEDVRMGVIDAAWGWRRAKLYTRVGMGPCQGRVCGSALAFLHGWEPDSPRPPCQPASVSTLMAAGARSATP